MLAFRLVISLIISASTFREVDVNFTDFALPLTNYLLHQFLSLIAVCIYHLVMISIKWSETAQKNALASVDVIVTQLQPFYIYGEETTYYLT